VLGPITLGEVVALGGLFVTAAGLVMGIYARLGLDKRQFALQMLSEWNRQTAGDRMKIEKAFPGLYERCIPLSDAEATALANGRWVPDPQRMVHASDSMSADGHDVREAVIRLLNYFEFVAAAVRQGAANSKIIRESFAGTMTRFYCLLGAFIEAERRLTSRNPWAPYSRFVYEAVRARKTGLEVGTCLDVEGDGQVRRFVCRGSAKGRGTVPRVLAPLPDGVVT